MTLRLDHAQKDADAAKRMSDTVALHLAIAGDIMEEVVNQWCVFALSDGRSDGVIYPTKNDAIDHQHGNPKDYCYLKITPDGITPKDAAIFLRVNRNPMIDTTAPEHVINPHIFPRFSNLTPIQRETLKKRAEHDWKEAQNARRRPT